MQTDKLSCVLWRITGLHTAFSVVLLAALLGMGAAQAGMYRWVDGNGRVHYSDTLPSTYQKSGSTEMSKQGLVIKRTQSEAERRAEAERLEQERLSEQARQQQAQLDRALTQTYTSEAEIDLARDRALEHHKLAIKGTQLRAKTVADNLAGLKERANILIKAGRPLSPNLKEQLDQASKESLELRRGVLSHEEALMKVREKYDTDKLRFRELTRK
ncbi:MAG: hypothetical protein B7X94_00610 [Hydrogenophilales bacterium 17-62-8]|nr:MAG: hypothetical protein B7X94_00610 [Hydrogenophilales bacterium 17-62-8]